MKSLPSVPKRAQACPSVPKRAQARPSTPKHAQEQLMGTYRDLLNLQKQDNFDVHKTSYRKKKKVVFRFASND